MTHVMITQMCRERTNNISLTVKKCAFLMAYCDVTNNDAILGNECCSVRREIMKTRLEFFFFSENIQSKRRRRYV